jgi:hypothetical protein
MSFDIFTYRHSLNLFLRKRSVSISFLFLALLDIAYFCIN